MAILHDVRLAVRNLVRTPGYTVAVVVTLALAIGANSAIFSAVYAVLLKPLSIRDPEALVVAWASDRPHNLPLVELSYDNFQHWAAESRSFSQLAAMGSSTWPARLDGPRESERLSSAGVSASFFETLGVAPELGRTFRHDDDRDIVGPVLRVAAVRVSSGVAIGAFISLVAARALNSLLAGVHVFDAATYAGVLTVMAAVVGLASYLPASHAMKIDLLAFLKRE